MLDKRHDSTFRLAQSWIATRYRNPRCSGMYVTSAQPGLDSHVRPLGRAANRGRPGAPGAEPTCSGAGTAPGGPSFASDDDLLPTDGEALPAQPTRHLPRSVERRWKLLVDPAHELESQLTLPETIVSRTSSARSTPSHTVARCLVRSGSSRSAFAFDRDSTAEGLGQKILLDDARRPSLAAPESPRVAGETPLGAAGGPRRRQKRLLGDRVFAIRFGWIL